MSRKLGITIKKNILLDRFNERAPGEALSRRDFKLLNECHKSLEL